MVRFVVRRLLLLVPILLGLSLLIFAGIRALPGGPAQALLGDRATPEAIAGIEHQYGLDKPIPEQYVKYLARIGSGDFGVSTESRRPVAEEFVERLPATVELAVAAMIVAVGIGVPLGLLAAKRYGKSGDHTILAVSLLGVSVPVFFTGIVLKFVFGVELGWLPTVGRVSIRTELEHPTNFYVLDALFTGNWAALGDALRHLVLPAVALAVIPMAFLTRITRAAVLDVQNEDYIRTARAKGLAPGIITRRHILRNAMLPIVTTIGLQVGLLLSGAVLTETVFAWPGLGTWLVDAIVARDYPVLQAGILIVAMIFVAVNLIVDLSYALLDPRIRYS